MSSGRPSPVRAASASSSGSRRPSRRSRGPRVRADRRRRGPPRRPRPAAASAPRPRRAGRRAPPRTGTTGGSAAGRGRAGRPRADRRRSGGASARRRVGAAGVRGEQRFEIAVGDERSTSWPSRPANAPVTASRSSRSRATLRRARWMSTRTAPSDRPSTPAISAVDISSTKRRISARRRSPGSRSTARQAPRPRRRGRGVGLEVERVAATVAAASSGASGRRRRRRRRSATALRAIWNSQTRNVEAPSPSAGRARSSNRPRFARADEERPLGGVLRLVMVAQLVERVAVHLGQVLPIEGLEPGRVRLGRLDEPPVAVEVGEARTALLRTVHSSRMPDGPSRYTARRRASVGASRTWRDLADQDRALAARVVRIGDDAGRPVAGSTPSARTVSVAVGPLEADGRGRSSAGGRPSRRRRSRPAAERVDARLEPLEEGVEQRPRSIGAAAGRLAQRRHRARPGPAGSRRRPSPR